MCGKILKTIIEWVWLLSCQDRWKSVPQERENQGSPFSQDQITPTVEPQHFSHLRLPPNFTTPVHPEKGNIWKMPLSEQQVERRFRVPDFFLLISSAPTARQTPRPAWGSLQRFGCQCRLATPTTFSFSVNVPQTVCVFNATLLLHLHMKRRPS